MLSEKPKAETEGSSEGVQPRTVAVEVRNVSRRFGLTEALRSVSLRVMEGEIHALLGPNGAGKTTLLRVLTGLVEPDAGEIALSGRHGTHPTSSRAARSLYGVVPSGDRTFYLRISGLENLLFFARLYGLRRADALRRAEDCLRHVGLEQAARLRVGAYSQGMQKRLSVARGILMRPPILLVDEATHSLDPEGARRIQDLISSLADEGTAVIWTTQRLDEIQDFADTVTILHEGRIRFAGPLVDLLAISDSKRYLVQLAQANGLSAPLLETARASLNGRGAIEVSSGSSSGHYLLSLQEGITLGDAVASMVGSGIKVLACREQRSQVEGAFLQLTGDLES